jgi:amino acid adenylation domain-containing protein
MQLPEFPLTPNGKLNRAALPVPEDEAYSRREYAPPQGLIEETLAAIWTELLGLERVGRYDSFFEMGGHSMLAVRMIARLRGALGLELPLGEIFAHPVLSALAQRVAETTLTTLPEIVPGERSGNLPLSYAQQRLWFLAQMEGVSEAYHIAAGLRLSGQLNQEALRFALDRIVQRHEALRTRFVVVDGEPAQQIDSAETGFALVEQDLEGEPSREEALASLAATEAAAPFDLERGPLIRGRLVRLGSQEHVLLVTMHHIVSDGWSIGVLVKEFSALYTAGCAGQQDPLPALAIQYGDYAQWQRQWLSGEVLESQAEYWRKTLSGAPALLELPTDHKRPVQQSHEGRQIAVELSAELTAGLKALSLRHGTTLFITVLAGFAALLSRLSGQEDIVIGTPVANRTRREIEGLIGFFVNTLALRLDVSGEPSVKELLQRIRQTTLSAQAQQDLPFEQVVELLRPARSLSHAPLFQVMFAWQNNEVVELDLPGLQVVALNVEQTIAKFDLTLDLAERGDHIVGTLEYATALFERGTVERFASYLIRLLEAMVAGEEQTVSRLAMLPAAERHQLLVEWNATETEYPSHRCVHELFEEQVERTPDATAVVFEDKELSYKELNRRANQLAHHLRDLGVRPDDRVAICVERNLEMVVGLLAVLKAGGAYVPLDPAYPSERLAWMLKDSEPVALLTQNHLVTLFSFADDGPGIPVLDLSDESFLSKQREEDPDAVSIGLASHHLAYVIYTSGSTGLPKGVMVEHRSINRLVLNTNYVKLLPTDVIAQSSNVSFDAATFEIWGALLTGARIVIVGKRELLSPLSLSRRITQSKITVLFLTTAVFHQVAREHPESLRTLRSVLWGGEQVEPRWVARVRDAGAPENLLHVYGPTETVTYASWYRVSETTDRDGPIPIGRPISNTRIYILNRQAEPAPVGVPGEIYIGGVGVARGYLKRPKLTEERFIVSPFVEGERLYRTGDLGRFLADGNIEFLGRNDFQVKIRGFRIELGEIEARLTSHSGVSEAVVLVRAHQDGDKRLVAYYTTAEAVEAETLRTHLSAVLPDYMVPSAYVALRAFPLTPNGKLDRQALPAPEDEAYARHSYEPPQGRIEETLAAIWCEVLGLERVGRHDNFFELGGHSLLAVRMIARLREVMGLEPPLQAIFKTQTLTLFADLLGESYEDNRSLVRLAGAEQGTPLICIHTTGDHIDYYRPLANALGHSFAVYGLYPPPNWWLEERDALEKLARTHVDTIQAQQPDGPYRLLGWSAGGCVAIAIAAELERRGAVISYLGLLDTPIRPAAEAILAHYWADTIHHHLLQYGRTSIPVHLLENLLRDPENVADADLEELLPWLQSGEDRLTLQSLRLTYQHLVTMAHQLKRIVEADSDPIQAPLHFCWANASPIRRHVYELDWTRLTTGTAVSFHEVIDGDHHTILEEPYVLQLATAIMEKTLDMSSKKE